MQTIVVFSHLRWDFVFQRPQHLLSRLAQDRKIIFIEEPLRSEASEAYTLVTHPLPNVPNISVCRFHTPLGATGFSDDQLPYLQPLLAKLIEDEKLDEYVVWFYTPMALPLAQSLTPKAMVYDCMDELSMFLGAPRQMIQRESMLMKSVDLVFTGGPSLYKAKKDKHSDVHCLPSSVDAAHFSQALQHAPASLEGGRPRLGFYGVIDERIDLRLIDALACAHPEWDIDMVGPVVKINPEHLPRHANVHYTGQKTYDELPIYLATWDVCLLPFAINDATRFISPTKTLEYMAAERLIVSTPITDVAEPYGAIVYIAEGNDFIAACEAALEASNAERMRRIEGMRRVLAETSWDRTVAMMNVLIAGAVERNLHKHGFRAHPEAPFVPDPLRQLQDARERSLAMQNFLPAAAKPSTPKVAMVSPSTAKSKSGADAFDAPRHKTVIIGAGPTGLSAAYHLGKEALLLEQNDQVGGWCRSISDHGFTFDYAGHIMFSNDDYVHQMYKMLLGDNVHWQDREAWVYSKKVYTRYPFQGALYGLPAQVIKECIVGAIEARYGDGSSDTGAEARADLSKTQHRATTKPRDSDTTLGKSDIGLDTPSSESLYASQPSIDDCCADGIAESSLPSSSSTPATCPAKSDDKSGTKGASKVVPIQVKATQPANFEDFIYQVWGKGIAKHFAIPYNRKIWAVPLQEMETSWLGGRVPMPNLEEMIDGALSPVGKPMGPNARFGYPLRGGFQALMEGFLPHLQGALELGVSVRGVSPTAHTVTLADGRTVPYEHLVSTMPLPKLITMIGAEAPQNVRAAAKGLRHTSVRCVNIGVGRENITDKHWIYYPEDTVFHRIFVQGNASPQCNAPGGFGFTCEITYSPSKPLPCEGPALIRRCIDDAIKVGFIRADDAIVTAHEVDMPYAYVIYDHARASNVETIRTWLLQHDIVLSGRYSEWEYYNSDHAFLAGKKAAEIVMALKQADKVMKVLPDGAGVSFGVAKTKV